MALFNYYPYTNFHELNLDWLLKTMKELLKSFEKLVEDNEQFKEDALQDVEAAIERIMALLNDDIEQYVEQYVNAHLSQFIMNASYVENERLIIFGETE